MAYALAIGLGAPDDLLGLLAGRSEDVRRLSLGRLDAIAGRAVAFGDPASHLLLRLGGHVLGGLLGGGEDGGYLLGGRGRGRPLSPPRARAGRP